MRAQSSRWKNSPLVVSGASSAHASSSSPVRMMRIVRAARRRPAWSANGLRGRRERSADSAMARLISIRVRASSWGATRAASMVAVASASASTCRASPAVADLGAPPPPAAAAPRRSPRRARASAPPCGRGRAGARDRRGQHDRDQPLSHGQPPWGTHCESTAHRDSPAHALQERALRNPPATVPARAGPGRPAGPRRFSCCRGSTAGNPPVRGAASKHGSVPPAPRARMRSGPGTF